MTCKEAIGQLYEYLDSELDKKNHIKIKKHLDICHFCCEKFEFEQALKNIIKTKSQFHKIPESTRENIIEQLSARHRVQLTSEPSTLRRLGIFQFLTLRPVYISFATIMPLVITALSLYLVFFKPTDYSSPIIEGVVEHHDKFVSSKDFLDISSLDLSELDRYIKRSNKSSLTTNVSNKDLSVSSYGALPSGQMHQEGNDIRFLGRKNFYLAGRKSVYVGLEKVPAKISFEMIDSSGIKISGLKKEFFRGKPYYCGKHKGYNVVLWKQGNTLYSLTSSMNRKELMRVANGTLCSPSE